MLEQAPPATDMHSGTNRADALLPGQQRRHFGPACGDAAIRRRGRAGCRAQIDLETGFVLDQGHSCAGTATPSKAMNPVQPQRMSRPIPAPVSPRQGGALLQPGKQADRLVAAATAYLRIRRECRTHGRPLRPAEQLAMIIDRELHTTLAGRLAMGHAGNGRTDRRSNATGATARTAVHDVTTSGISWFRIRRKVYPQPQHLRSLNAPMSLVMPIGLY